MLGAGVGSVLEFGIGVSILRVGVQSWGQGAELGLEFRIGVWAKVQSWGWD